MKRCVFLLLLLWAVPTCAQVIESFHVVLEVRDDGMVAVTERIAVRFDIARRGIFREIPLGSTLPTGERYRVRASVDSVQANGASVPVRQTTEGGYLVLRIGDPDRLIRGTVNYTIAYRLERALRRYEDEVELYWNAVGHEWEMPIREVTVEVHVPTGTDEDRVDVVGFQGPVGSREPFDLAWENTLLIGKTEGLNPGEGVTIGVRVPAETVTLPGAWQSFLWFVSDNRYVAIPLITLLGMAGMWAYRGRSPAQGSISPVFVRPEGLGPAEAGTLIDDRVDTHDITAGIIDLAVKGHLRIHEIWEDPQDKAPDDFELERLSGGDSPTPFEGMLLGALFQGADQKKLSDLHYKLHDKLPGLSAQLYMDLTQRKYYDGNPDRVRSGYQTVGSLGIVGGIALWAVAGSMYLGLSVGAAGLIILAFSGIMPRKTHKGMQVLREVLGLEEYISRAETDRMEFAAAENHFEELLPYAIAFDLTEVWAKKFEGLLRQPPGWYDGRFHTFSPYWMGYRMAMLQRSAHRAATTTPRQASGGWRGGSAFGGGGFSGGGMGGGGGRAW